MACAKAPRSSGTHTYSLCRCLGLWMCRRHRVELGSGAGVGLDVSTRVGRVALALGSVGRVALAPSLATASESGPALVPVWAVWGGRSRSWRWRWRGG